MSLYQRPLRSDELMHWGKGNHKYIDKVKSGNGWKYFYTMEELKAFRDRAARSFDQARQNAVNRIGGAKDRVKKAFTKKTTTKPIQTKPIQMVNSKSREAIANKNSNARYSKEDARSQSAADRITNERREADANRSTIAQRKIAELTNRISGTHEKMLENVKSAYKNASEADKHISDNEKALKEYDEAFAKYSSAIANENAMGLPGSAGSGAHYLDMVNAEDKVNKSRYAAIDAASKSDKDLHQYYARNSRSKQMRQARSNAVQQQSERRDRIREEMLRVSKRRRKRH